VLVELGFRIAASEVEVRAPAFGVEARRNGDRLDERRLAAAILADEERDGWTQGRVLGVL
jgi:hypothetical protein